MATKAADIAIGFIDRFSGALIISGDISAVEAALKDIVGVLSNQLGFTPTSITRT